MGGDECTQCEDIAVKEFHASFLENGAPGMSEDCITYFLHGCEEKLAIEKGSLCSLLPSGFHNRRGHELFNCHLFGVVLCPLVTSHKAVKTVE